MAKAERTEGRGGTKNPLALEILGALEETDSFRWEPVQRHVVSADHGSAVVNGFQTIMLSDDGAYRVCLEEIKPEPPSKLRSAPYRLVMSHRGDPNSVTVPVVSEEGQRRAKILYGRLTAELGTGTFDGKRLIEDLEAALKNDRLR